MNTTNNGSLVSLQPVQFDCREILFDLPHGLDLEMAAKIFSGYLNAGQRISEAGSNGPFLEHDKYQLDGSNNFWLSMSSEDPEKASLRCRYAEPKNVTLIEGGQPEVLVAMFSLFRAKYIRKLS